MYRQIKKSSVNSKFCLGKVITTAAYEKKDAFKAGCHVNML